MLSIKKFTAIAFGMFLFSLVWFLKADLVNAQSGCGGSFRCCIEVDVHGNCITESPAWVACQGGGKPQCEDPKRFCATGVLAVNGCYWTDPNCNCNYSYCQYAYGTYCGFPGVYCNSLSYPYCFTGEEFYSQGICTGGSTCFNAGTGSYVSCGSCAYGYGDANLGRSYWAQCIASCGGAPTPTFSPPPPTAVPTPIPTPIPPPSCTIAFGSPSYDVDAGLTTVVSASPPLPPISGTIDEYEFTIGSTAVATICFFGTGPCAPGAGSVVGASSIIDLTGVTPSTTTITATARMLDEGASCTTFVPSTVTVNNPSSWWQVKEGDAVTDGLISSAIPPTAYEDYLIVHDAPGEYPGVATFRGSLNPNPPDISTTNWNADSAYSGTIPNYTFFEGRVSASTLIAIMTNPIDAGVLTSGPLINGYHWYKYDGADYGFTPLVINDPSGTVNLTTNKVVLFVKDADLIIQSKINLTDGQGFFMAISERNIVVDPTVGGAHDTSPDLEGIYIADQDIQTGAGTQQLHVRGSVVGNQGVALERVPTDNSLYPAELFEYAVDAMMLFPGDLTPNRIQWREVAP